MTSHYFFVAASALVLSTSAMAAGSHAGGHSDAAIGQPGVAAKVTRTVQIDMKDDMRFHADTFKAKRGETIRFVIKNSGALKHEMVLGTEKDLKDHYEVMKKHPEMEHAEPNMVTLAPGKTGEIIWQFTKAGKIDFACLQPGHFDAGMKGFINVTTR
ncbi:MAG: plastocyanin/azurin family copper-binding protein [Polaromonas sp.]